MTLSPIRKALQGVADRTQMYRMFNRHRGDPALSESQGQHLFVGEWFEIAEAEHDYMLDILPPLWMHPDMFAMREFLTGSVTSVYFSLSIDGRKRFFHGYCDLSDSRSPEHLKRAIVERESSPARAMTREERLEHIWSTTHDDYRGYADERWPEPLRGARTILVYSGECGTQLKLLDQLTEAEIAAKLPVQLRICRGRSPPNPGPEALSLPASRTPPNLLAGRRRAPSSQGNFQWRTSIPSPSISSTTPHFRPSFGLGVTAFAADPDDDHDAATSTPVAAIPDASLARPTSSARADRGANFQLAGDRALAKGWKDRARQYRGHSARRSHRNRAAAGDRRRAVAADPVHRLPRVRSRQLRLPSARRSEF